jgi:hypothetical protein
VSTGSVSGAGQRAAPETGVTYLANQTGRVEQPPAARRRLHRRDDLVDGGFRQVRQRVRAHRGQQVLVLC